MTQITFTNECAARVEVMIDLSFRSAAMATDHTWKCLWSESNNTRLVEITYYKNQPLRSSAHWGGVP